MGISREHLGKLFQPFAQATAEISRTHGGTGLGLAISRSFAQLMGGDVVVRSQPGRGSCFRCSIVARATELSCVVPTLPSAADRPAPKNQPDVVLADRIPLRILAADDIRTNREVLRRISAHFGYSPDLCVNGVEVLAALAQRMYDLVLLDVQMPVMDGLTAAREINRLYPDPARRPKLVAITANALPGDREKCLAAGMDDYLTKPLLPEHLEAGILHWFAGAPKAPAPVARASDNTELPLIDHGYLAAAFPDMSGPVLVDVLSQLQAAALTDYGAALARLTESCDRHDSAATATELHALKGCFLTIGWKRLAGRCTETLQTVRAGKFSAWASLPGELSALCGESRTAMAAHLARLAPSELVENSPSR
jgi:CheY-like chemotaxis protein